jgi:hypothetical protein
MKIASHVSSRRACNTPMLTKATGLLRSENSFTWIFADLILLKVPMGRNTFVLSLMISLMSVLQSVASEKQHISYYKKTKAFIEQSTGCKIKAIWVDGALELTAGRMGNHLASRASLSRRQYLTHIHRLGR